jgi:16S rRNA (guanine(966)-N(2))-methyltransferase RsmD
VSTLRVTGGRYRGRVIEVPQGDFEIRPAMDRMRESLFSILGDLSGKSFLDLFSGSGIMGIEAASRGADPVLCVERDRPKLSQLIRNVSLVETRIECKAVPVERYLLRCERTWSIIFLDPPFPYAFKPALIQSIAERELLAPGGIAVIHYPKSDIMPDSCLSLRCVDEREYGRSHVRFYSRGSAEPGET